jgi:hypothetical protein
VSLNVGTVHAPSFSPRIHSSTLPKKLELSALLPSTTLEAVSFTLVSAMVSKVGPFTHYDRLRLA